MVYRLCFLIHSRLALHGSKKVESLKAFSEGIQTWRKETLSVETWWKKVEKISNKISPPALA
jgi:hypothetical protein